MCVCVSMRALCLYVFSLISRISALRKKLYISVKRCGARIGVCRARTFDEYASCTVGSLTNFIEERFPSSLSGAARVEIPDVTSASRTPVNGMMIRGMSIPRDTHCCIPLTSSASAASRYYARELQCKGEEGGKGREGEESGGGVYKAALTSRHANCSRSISQGTILLPPPSYCDHLNDKSRSYNKSEELHGTDINRECYIRIIYEAYKDTNATCTRERKNSFSENNVWETIYFCRQRDRREYSLLSNCSYAR